MEHKVEKDREYWFNEEPKAIFHIYYPTFKGNGIGSVTRKIENWCDEGIEVRTYAEAQKIIKEWLKEFEEKHIDDWPNQADREAQYKEYLENGYQAKEDYKTSGAL